MSDSAPLLFTIDRTVLGDYMYNQAVKAGAIVKLGYKVNEIFNNYVVSNGNRFYFNFLIGADGSASIVRKYLGIKTKDIGIGIQFFTPKRFSSLDIYLDPKKLGGWYLWVFPHDNGTYIGLGGCPTHVNTKNIKRYLVDFSEKHFNITQPKIEAAIINVDYQGFRFGNIFLAGDAAGLASCLTGEGIYQAIVSGEEISKKILHPKYNCHKLNLIIFKNRLHFFAAKFLFRHRIIAYYLYRSLFKLLKYK